MKDKHVNFWAFKVALPCAILGLVSARFAIMFRHSSDTLSCAFVIFLFLAFAALCHASYMCLCKAAAGVSDMTSDAHAKGVRMKKLAWPYISLALAALLFCLCLYLDMMWMKAVLASLAVFLVLAFGPAVFGRQKKDSGETPSVKMPSHGDDSPESAEAEANADCPSETRTEAKAGTGTDAEAETAITTITECEAQPTDKFDTLPTDSFPEDNNTPDRTATNWPTLFADSKALVLFDGLVKENILAEGYKKKDGTETAQLAYMLGTIYEILNTNPRWKEFEQFWNVNNLRQSYNQSVARGTAVKNQYAMKQAIIKAADGNPAIRSMARYTAWRKENSIDD